MIDFSTSPACIALIELVDRLGFGLSVTRDTGTVLSHQFSSPNMQRMTGVGAGQLPGRTIMASVAEQERPRVGDGPTILYFFSSRNHFRYWYYKNNYLYFPHSMWATLCIKRKF